MKLRRSSGRKSKEINDVKEGDRTENENPEQLVFLKKRTK